MTNPIRTDRLDLQEIASTNRNARHIITGFALALPTLTEIWRYLDTALADTPRLATEVEQQRAAIAAVRLDRANLLAVIRAALAAARDGEPDPLAYLHDELANRPADPGSRG